MNLYKILAALRDFTRVVIELLLSIFDKSNKGFSVM